MKSKDYVFPMTANGSDRTATTWVEDAEGKRVCTMKPGPEDWTFAKLIAVALNDDAAQRAMNVRQ